MSFLNKLKSKAQEALQSSSSGSSSQQQNKSGPPWTHNGQSLDFNPDHLRSQNASIPQPPSGSDATIRTQSTATWPPQLKSHQYHPAMTFLNPSGKPHAVMRDLGFSSVLGGRIIWTWGDTLMGTSESSMICAVDSTSIGTLASKAVTLDSAVESSGNVTNWINCTPEEEAAGGLGTHAFGGTNIIEFPPNSGHGVVYYLKNHRPGGQSVIKGAGIARVTLRADSNIPKSQRVGDILWNEYEPWYGDVGSVLDPRDGKIYVYGHGPAWDGELSARTYLARVDAGRATDINAYEYWRNGAREWTPQRQANGSFGTALLTKEDAIFDWHVMNQAVPFWSVYFNKWLFIHGSSWPDSDVLLRSADALEGPWEDHGKLCSTAPQGTEQGFRYCITGHPEYDDSGRSVFVTWTRENVIYGVTVEWA